MLAARRRHWRLPAHCPAARRLPPRPAAPAYQLQQYYIHGRVDDCSGRWTALIDCLKKRTKYKEAVRCAVLCCAALRCKRPGLEPLRVFQCTVGEKQQRAAVLQAGGF